MKGISWVAIKKAKVNLKESFLKKDKLLKKKKKEKIKNISIFCISFDPTKILFFFIFLFLSKIFYFIILKEFFLIKFNIKI